MTGIPTPNTQAILLLTAPLIVGRASEGGALLSPGEYNRLARFLRESQRQPGDLIGTTAAETIKLCTLLPRERLEALLNRGFLLSQAVERWSARSIWVIGRPDPGYPRRLKSRLKEDAPPLLYGCGDIRLLEQGGLAVVGSRHIDEEQMQFSEKVGRIAAEAGRAVISGGAKGVDRSAMGGALIAGGSAVGILAESLERAALARENREPLMDGKLVLVSPYDPAAGFNVGHAMQRNKIVYALSDAGLVVNSDFEKGGTWAGAVEQLERFRFVPVFVRNGANIGKGNKALLERGGLRWPEPSSGAEFVEALASFPRERLAQTKQEMLELREAAPVYETAHGRHSTLMDANAVTVEEAAGQARSHAAASTPAEKLFAVVRSLFHEELKMEKTEAQIVEILGITKPQGKAWLKRLLADGLVEKVKKSRPLKYRSAEPLL